MDVHLDHLYRETTRWDDSVDFWKRLGFSFTEQWGTAPHRAGRMIRDAASLVLAEISQGADVAATPFFAVSDIDEFSGEANAHVVETHWGTRMVTVTDPDGRTYHFEAKGSG